MVYLQLENNKFFIGLQWLEIIHSIDEAKGELNKNIENAFKQVDANFGVKLVTEDESVYSLGILPGKRKPFSYPSVYSLAATIAENLSNGVVFLKIETDLFDDSISKELQEESDKFLNTRFNKNVPPEGFWWACIIQDGVVISDGEFIGDEEGLADFILEGMTCSDSIKLFGQPNAILESLLLDVKFNSMDIGLLTDKHSYKNKIDQLVGLPVKRLFFIGIALLTTLGLYKVTDIVLNKEPVKMAVEEARAAVPFVPNNADFEKKQKETLYLQEIQSNRETFNLKRMDFNSFNKSLLKYNNGYTFGWRLSDVSCSIEGCKLSFYPESNLNSIERFVDYYSLDKRDFNLIGSANEIIVNERSESQPNDASPEITLEGIKFFFGQLPTGKDALYEVTTSAVKLSGSSKTFDWTVKQSRDISFVNKHPSSEYPTGFNLNYFEIKSEELSQLNKIIQTFQQLKVNVFLKQIKADISKEGKISYSMQYEYLTKL